MPDQQKVDELKRRLTPYGVWTGSRQWTDLGRAREVAAEVESLGYGAIWVGSSSMPFTVHEALLAGSTDLLVVTGIVSIWENPAAAVAARYAELDATYGSRFVLGLGNSHAQQVGEQTYVKPYSRTVAYLDELDGAGTVPEEGRLLAALRPRMLGLAGSRTAGAHPYLMPPEHTAHARAVLGAGPLLAAEQKVVLETDPARARAVARERLSMYLGLPNYTNALLDYGLVPEDFEGEGSDRWVDLGAAWGEEEAVRARLHAHRDAGADHVLVQVLTERGLSDLPLPEWRRLASALQLT
ncbi:TIGR03620 family F420-dependent LLM class oxidoreductase [Nocardioides sp. KC13]|uniref:TIGR03620 family F420-dependent LLM class oxidoreductase n=1 Tax=Nocardioides turkmenicus TaxID=2711220 RepID=A0A6M1QNW9_9ACTN|nr:TIGR03620 family F420-dependent LLM class oxidoreductase [Nocardioides sp. KC13]NGN91345.1 TIGR03620 family F420-dependent LLM class oxidoreductase [Nocardioides sp. KC13]